MRPDSHGRFPARRPNPGLPGPAGAHGPGPPDPAIPPQPPAPPAPQQPAGPVPQQPAGPVPQQPAGPVTQQPAPPAAGSLAPPAAPPVAVPPTVRLGSGRASRVLPVVVLPAVDAAALAVAGAASVTGLAGGTRLAAAPVTVYVLAVLTAQSRTGLHRLRMTLCVSDQAGRILTAILVPAALLGIAGLIPAGLIRAGPLARAPIAAGGVAHLALVSAALVLAARAAANAVLRAARRRGALAEPALIVGSGTFGAHLAGQIREHPELGLRVTGFLEDGPPRRDLLEPTLGGPGDLARVVRELGIRRVLICFGETRDEDLVPILRASGRLAADVCVVPRLHELGLALSRASLDEIWGIPLIPLRRLGRGRASLALKRTFDITVAAVLLAAAAPLLLVLGVVIRWQTGQSALFRQLRVTGPGRQSTILKLRTITETPGSRTWAVDPAQCTALGRWLRATHVDELPQLINVLRGDMSLVGPRPERGYFAADFARHIPRYADRDRMRAGLTGWAQVHGLHGDTSIAERSRFDNTYIEYWSPWLDLVILVKTIVAAVAGLGASR
jgi:exopolysaccharide biosynthesis polyprenyl glycosylphosphotransferase